MKSAAGGVGGPSLKTFRDESAVDAYLCNLANDLMLVSDNKPTAIFKTSDEDPVESLGKMVSVLDTAGNSLADVHSRAERHVSYLQVRTGNEADMHRDDHLQRWRSSELFQMSMQPYGAK